METKLPVIALDGPAGSGKSTIAKLVAKRLGLRYIDTGAMYRAVTLMAIREKVNTKCEEDLIALVKRCSIEFKYEEKGLKVFVNGLEVTEDIRLPEVSKSSSDIADSVGVRKHLVSLQQKMGKFGGVILDGRDIGSLVFPNAEFKFYLDASVEERAKRRFKELKAKSIEQSLEEVKIDIMARDKRDKERAFGALKLVPDAIKVDTSDLSIEEVVNIIASRILSKGDVQI
ncbi:MAG: cytidylate kinase [Candidatus Firestonebacteria bacterium RIFOXYC2_FULL_39_67]|nr:MAG: cytidylate kinase [Candidatus Firestonebacteria bacterium RIFOXYD2_FULL_39_29]OGF57011.1 MAG: cytidylate kinase [Candidatus Firestonebacteria bacterium RIFOXYC2_FULL_39_67]